MSDEMTQYPFAGPSNPMPLLLPRRSFCSVDHRKPRRSTTQWLGRRREIDCIELVHELPSAQKVTLVSDNFILSDRVLSALGESFICQYEK